MTDVNNLFNDDPIDNTNYLEELVGDGKKFRTVEDLAKGKAESDRFIEQLKQQLDDARTEVQKRIALEELKTAILERDNNGGNREVVDTPPNPNPNVDANSIEELIRKTLLETKTTETRTANEQIVATTLTEVWGDNAKAELAKAAQTVGMPVSELRDLGQKNPKALFKLIGIGDQPIVNGGAVPRSSTSTTSTSLNGERTKSYYDKLRTSDPKAYWDKRIQVQMNKDALRLGADFYK